MPKTNAKQNLVEEITTQAPGWEAKAGELAARGASFTLFPFHYSHHIHFYNELKKQFDLEGRIQPEANVAHFQKRGK